LITLKVATIGPHLTTLRWRRRMTYDELSEALAELFGRMVEATIQTPYEDPESGSGGEWYGSFSGEVDRLGDEAISGTGSGRSIGAMRSERDPMRGRSRFGAAALKGQR
jgi:hypothetical protein